MTVISLTQARHTHVVSCSQTFEKEGISRETVIDEIWVCTEELVWCS